MTEAPVYECVEVEEIVEFCSGEVEIERIEELLDHVDDCKECASNLAVVIALRSHREEALELLRRAGDWKGRNTCSDH